VWIEPTPREQPKPVRVISAKARHEHAKKAAEEARKQFAETHKTTKLGTLITDYHHTLEARKRSQHLNSLIRNLTASASKKVPHNGKVQ
jgi:hypothetical protein